MAGSQSRPQAALALTVPHSTGKAIRKALAEWYDRTRRDLPWRRIQDPYAIWVSEVMLQQTQVKTVIPYYHRFLEKYPTVHHLASSDLQAVLKCWEGLGYYSRARHLHRAARIIVADLGGRLPETWPAMRQLPGVGDYIAAAVLSIAFAKPYAVVDGNVKRVLARLFVMATPVNLSTAHKAFQAVADQLLDTGNPGRHNQAMMELGAEVCVPRRPLCRHCPLTQLCRAQLSRTTDQFPARIQRRAVGRQHWVAGLVIRQGRLLLTRRPDTGLLGGLWELPGGVVRAGERPVRACADRIRDVVGLDVRVARHLATVNHAYTHFKLHLDIYLCNQPEGRVRRNGPSAHEWVSYKRLERLPLHKAVHKALPVIREMVEGP